MELYKGSKELVEMQAKAMDKMLGDFDELKEMNQNCVSRMRNCRKCCVNSVVRLRNRNLGASAPFLFRISFYFYNRKERMVMIKWVKGFIAGISSVALIISFGLVIFYKALVEDMRSTSRHRYGTSYSNYDRRKR